MIVGGVLFWFAIRQEVSYQSMVGGRITEAGVGQTLEINSREVRFSSRKTSREAKNSNWRWVAGPR
jgi:hypothetical protein